VALPASEAFKIEYWALEEAKLRRQPPEKELSRWIVLVVGGASGIGRSTAALAASRGANVVVADRNLEDAQRTADKLCKDNGAHAGIAVAIDIRDRESIRRALREAVSAYGGIDAIVNTAAVFPTSPTGVIEAARILKDQDLDASVVLTSSANAVVAKRGSEAYDVSKAAVSHLVRELAISLAPRIRVNGVSPATVVTGSTMFSRERVTASLHKYNIAFEPNATDDQLSSLLAAFYAKRSLTLRPVHPDDCAQAGTTGHLIPVDGGLTDAFLR
jgi:NAD(P)-dependent dehydrogenase (short-subunit alcohol dehydrogenase family)